MAGSAEVMPTNGWKRVRQTILAWSTTPACIALLASAGSVIRDGRCAGRCSQ